MTEMRTMKGSAECNPKSKGFDISESSFML